MELVLLFRQTLMKKKNAPRDLTSYETLEKLRCMLMGVKEGTSHADSHPDPKKICEHGEYMDIELAEWAETWGRVKYSDDVEERKTHLRKLLCYGLGDDSSKDYRGQMNWFSFCRGQWVGAYFSWHCRTCGECNNWEGWHCGDCNQCTHCDDIPCEGCGGVSFAWCRMPKLGDILRPRPRIKP
ncbi:hypothetical protein EV356DRAFT_384949 [Viridothelium virens]|uniref:Uncharacterized protein n=1 Tax=Viridothelium virens TaxID=1048519 RepID=A0A6A6GUS9_VIRVR|nr:hypothetical protein EV356DRAFT_384949 [Viridothelium virens]